VAAAPAHATAPYVRKTPPLTTPWTRSVSTTTPLPEYPRPQLERDAWLNLNGRWQFEDARANAPPPFGRDLVQTILVPFPVQSPLSGIERPITSGWYRRTFRAPAAWRGDRVMLNFGAVSWAARVYVNGRLAGTHRGDYDSFSLDITPLLRSRGENELMVGYSDPVGRAQEPVGKQVPGSPYGYHHTASSGIWQTVWLEAVSARHLTDLDLAPEQVHGSLTLKAAATGDGRTGQPLSAEALAGGRVVARATGRSGRPLTLVIPHPRAWSPSDPYLYDLRVSLLDHGSVVDRVRSYFGLRSIELGQAGGFTRLLLNGSFLFQSGALAQGYWPDGLYTAPTDAALRFDLVAAKRLGFNMLREHVKVEPARFYLWAARLGVLIWQDMPNMPLRGAAHPNAAARAEFAHELGAVVRQHRSEPAIVAWVPFNEGWGAFDPAGITGALRRLDPTRPIDTDSGSANCCGVAEAPSSDIRDVHLYSGPFTVQPDRRAAVIGEYGGVLPFPPGRDRFPGRPTSIGAPAASWPLTWVTGVLSRQFAALQLEMRAYGLSGAVFTELGAYEQELGIVSYDRRVFTLPPNAVRAMNTPLIASSSTLSSWHAPPAIPPGASGVWQFDEGAGMLAADASGQGHALRLLGGAGWAPGMSGSALAIRRPGQLAASAAALIDTTRSYTVSAWLNPALAGQSGSAVSQAAPAGSAFSLGLQTSGSATRWTFLVPNRSGCAPIRCGVRANTHYDDGRFSPSAGNWHQVTGVYDATTLTISISVDGVPEDIEHVTAPPASNGPLILGTGQRAYPRSDAFLGALDELRLYPRALRPEQVWQLYQALKARRSST
jgi:hypothetical protein